MYPSLRRKWISVLLIAISSATVAQRTDNFDSEGPITIGADLFCEWGVLVPVSLNGAGPFWMILDSGSTITSLSTRTSNELRLPLGLSRQGSGAGEQKYDLYSITPPVLSVDGTAVHARAVLAADLEPTEEIAGRRLDGILGNDVFQNYVVEIDYPAHRIRLQNKDTFSYTGNGIVLPLEQKNHLLFTTAGLTIRDTTYNLRLIVDTGGFGVPIILYTPFVNTHHLAQRGMPGNRAGVGQGGSVHVLFTRADSLQLGAVSLKRPIVALSQNLQGSLAGEAFDGLLGGQVLRRFRVIFDLVRHELILEPNGGVSDPFESDRSGIAVRSAHGDNGRVEIYDVMPHSPAAALGIKVGDYLEAVDGKSAASFTLDELRRRFHGGPPLCVLTIRHGDKIRTVKLSLRMLV